MYGSQSVNFTAIRLFCFYSVTFSFFFFLLIILYNYNHDYDYYIIIIIIIIIISYPDSLPPTATYTSWR